jgi:hypothetical protein
LYVKKGAGTLFRQKKKALVLHVYLSKIYCTFLAKTPASLILAFRSRPLRILAKLNLGTLKVRIIKQRRMRWAVHVA